MGALGCRDGRGWARLAEVVSGEDPPDVGVEGEGGLIEREGQDRPGGVFPDPGEGA
jgi:hypothetical protein